MDRVEDNRGNPTEILDYWLQVSRTWRRVIGAPLILRAEREKWPGDSEECRRKRKHLLDWDVLRIALLLYQAGKNRCFSARELTSEIAEDDSNLTMDRARKRVNRIVRVMEAYRLLTVKKSAAGRVQYQISGTDELAELLEWFTKDFPTAPPSLVPGESDTAVSGRNVPDNKPGIAAGSGDRGASPDAKRLDLGAPGAFNVPAAADHGPRERLG